MSKTAEKKTESTAVTKAPLRTGGNVTAIIPQDVEQAHRMATAIVRGRMAPKSFNDNAEAVMVAIMHGMEVGLTPMAAVQSIAVINGMPTIWGDGALGLVQASGLAEDIDEQPIIDDKTGKTIGFRCIAKRAGRKSPIERVFTLEMAEKAGLTKKTGPWQQYPERMMQMRARAWALRDGFADVLRGLHSAEEVRDMGPLVDSGDGTYAPRPQRADYADDGQGEPIDANVVEDIGQEPVKREPYTLVSEVGEIVDEITGSGTYADELIRLIGKAKSLEALNTLMENNVDTISRMRDEELDEHVDSIHGWFEKRERELAEAEEEAKKQPEKEQPKQKDAKGNPEKEPEPKAEPDGRPVPPDETEPATEPAAEESAEAEVSEAVSDEQLLVAIPDDNGKPSWIGFYKAILHLGRTHGAGHIGAIKRVNNAALEEMSSKSRTNYNMLIRELDKIEAG